MIRPSTALVIAANTPFATLPGAARPSSRPTQPDAVAEVVGRAEHRPRRDDARLGDLQAERGGQVWRLHGGVLLSPRRRTGTDRSRCGWYSVRRTDAVSAKVD